MFNEMFKLEFSISIDKLVNNSSKTIMVNQLVLKCRHQPRILVSILIFRPEVSYLSNGWRTIENEVDIFARLFIFVSWEFILKRRGTFRCSITLLKLGPNSFSKLFFLSDSSRKCVSHVVVPTFSLIYYNIYQNIKMSIKQESIIAANLGISAEQKFVLWIIHKLVERNIMAQRFSIFITNFSYIFLQLILSRHP